MRVKTLFVGTLAFCLFTTAPAFAQNLLTNGSFETGDFTGWTTGGNFQFTSVTSGAYYDYSGAEDGLFYATLGPVGSDGTLSQTFSSSPASGYTLSFWFAAAGDGPSDFSVLWDGVPVLSLSNPNTGGMWTQYSFTVTTTGSDTLTFSFRDDPEYMALDNIAVVAASPTAPEPGSFLLLGTGVLGLAGFVRHKLWR